MNVVININMDFIGNVAEKDKILLESYSQILYTIYKINEEHNSVK